MSPYQIAILLHYYGCADDWPHPAPILEETLQGFIEDGLLVPNERGSTRLRGTEKLHCYIKHICNLPLPVWTMEQQP